MNVISVKVLLTNAMDIVVIDTDMPCPMVKEALPSQEPLSVMFHATYDSGIEYVRKHFNIEPKIINNRF